MRREAVYISGPMSGRKDFNKNWFNRTERELAARCIVPLNPHEFLGEDFIKVLHRFCPTFAWYLAMARDVVILVFASFKYDLRVLTHKEWKKSRGAIVEVRLAKKLGVGIIHWGEYAIYRRKV